MAYKDKTTEIVKLAGATAQNVINSAQRQGFLDSMSPRTSKIRSSSMNAQSPYSAVAPESKVRFASNTFAAQKSTRDLWDDASGRFAQGSLVGNVFAPGGRIARPGAPTPVEPSKDSFVDRPVSGKTDETLFGSKGLDSTVASADSALRRPIAGAYVAPSPDTENAFDVFRNHAVYGNGNPEDMKDATSALTRIGGRLFPTPSDELQLDL